MEDTMYVMAAVDGLYGDLPIEGVAHLSDDGEETLCGRPVYMPLDSATLRGQDECEDCFA